MPMQAWFPDETRSVAPGENLRLVLTVENPTPHPDTFTITPTGLNLSWVTVSEPSVTLPGGAARVVDVWVHPPRIASTTAGRGEVSVRIVAESDPSVALTSDAVVTVEAFDDRELAVLQPIVRGRRHATFEVIVRNDGNEMANCRMRLLDSSQRLEGVFDPPTVGVSPGEAATVRLKTLVRGPRFRRAERLLPFQIEASETEHTTATVSATVLQPATLSEDWIGRAASTIAIIVVLAAGWLLFARGWIDNRVDARVEDRLGTLRMADSGEVTEIAPAASSGGTDEPGDRSGEPTAVRLAPEVGVGETAADQYQVDAGTTLYITDLVLQNPAQDDGRAVLSIGEEILYEWDLSDMAGLNEFQPRITPLPVPGGSELRFSVECDSAGADSVSGCRAALLVTGRLSTTAASAGQNDG